MKICGKCKVEQASSEFYSNGWCKTCAKEYSARRYEEGKSRPVGLAEKVCTSCKYELPAESFKVQPNNSDGLMGECAECFRNRVLVRKFGLTAAEYDRMNEEQNGKCAICKKTCLTGRALAVDHDHDTGRVRELLCAKCNRGLGMFDDELILLIEAARYLKRNEVTD